MKAILLPGFKGSANQPLLIRCAARLEALGISCERHALSKGRPSAGLNREVRELEGVCDEAEQAGGRLLLVGRSFGGRVCARAAAFRQRHIAALVLLAFPIRPPKKPRPEDEAALLAIRCPTLIVQGDADDLGPLRVLRPLVKKNPALCLHVVRGAGHSFGRHEQNALEAVAQWLPLHT